MVRLGGYAMLLKEVADRVMTLKDRRRVARRRETTKNLLLGATIGTAAGAAAGLLFAPHSGKQTRDRISQRTSRTLDTIRTRVSSVGDQVVERVQDRASRLRDAAEGCSESIKEAVMEPAEVADTKGKKKK
jgi:gas vesicle protein